MSYRLKTVAELVGVPRPTLVAWERRFGVLDPPRTEAGYRVYSDADVHVLLKIKALLDGGLRISEAVDRIKDERARRNLYTLFPTAELPPNARELLMQALLEFDRGAAERLVVPATDPSWERVLDEVYLPALRDIGSRWATGDATVAQEHFASSFLMEQVSARFHLLNAGPANGNRAACVCCPGEQHALAMMVTATRLAQRGFRVTLLGADLPLAELCVWVVRYPVELLCVTVHMQRPDLLDMARQLRSHAPPATVVALGGPGLAGMEEHATGNLWFHSSFESFWSRWETRSAPRAGPARAASFALPTHGAGPAR